MRHTKEMPWDLSTAAMFKIPNGATTPATVCFVATVRTMTWKCSYKFHGKIYKATLSTTREIVK